MRMAKSAWDDDWSRPKRLLRGSGPTCSSSGTYTPAVPGGPVQHGGYIIPRAFSFSEDYLIIECEQSMCDYGWHFSSRHVVTQQFHDWRTASPSPVYQLEHALAELDPQVFVTGMLAIVEGECVDELVRPSVLGAFSAVPVVLYNCRCPYEIGK